MEQLLHVNYHECDNNVFETMLKTFRKYNDEATIVVTTDGLSDSYCDDLRNLYGVVFDFVDKEDMEGRRALCKIEGMHRLAILSPNCEIIAGDADIYYKDNPFKAFDVYGDFHLGITTRHYAYHFPINAGMIFMRVNSFMEEFLKWHVEQSTSPTWKPYVEHRRKHDHERFGHDWTVGQDFMICVWRHRAAIEGAFGIIIKEIGPEYNYCPPRDLLGEENAAKDIVNAYRNRPDIKVLHLKSSLKDLIYSNELSDCVLKHDVGNCNWREVYK